MPDRQRYWVLRGKGEPRSLHDWYEDGISWKEKTSWRQWKHENLVPYPEALLDRYFELGFKLIAINPTGEAKIPLEEWSRPEAVLSRREAWLWTKAGGNIAVLLGPKSKLLAVDLDNRQSLGQEPHGDHWIELSRKTLTTKTPGGYHLLISCHRVAETRHDILKENYPEADFRWTGQYVLLPLSRHKTGELYDFLDWENQLAGLADAF